jgi:nitroimidazol reductase NimA-like FMN-containing flavoprotein (pyridoxamine 5'-phosphate oxidase superfamily)
MREESAPPGAYPVTGRNRARRMHERASYDHAAVHAILDAAMLCHVAYVVDGQPYCTPTTHWREGNRLYWHGSSASRMLRAQAAGLPVCVTVTHLDGLVLARSGFNHSANYRSAMCFGTARLVDDPAEKAAALHAMIERFYPGRDAALRPISAQELKATSVVGMEIEQASAKVRAKGNVDEPEDLAVPVWAGVIPVTTLVGNAQPCPHNGAQAPAAGLEAYRPGTRLDQALERAREAWQAARR